MDTSVFTAGFYVKGGNHIYFDAIGIVAKFRFLRWYFHWKQELEDQVFDILSLWASAFGGNPEHHINQAQDLASNIRLANLYSPLSSPIANCLVLFIRF